MTSLDPLELPFFVVGAERSGTTLLRLMLDHHPKVSCFTEMEFVVEPMSSNRTWPDMDATREWLSTNRMFTPLSLRIDPSLDYPALMQSFLAQQADRRPAQYIGATCHRDFDRLPRIWPGARFIHILRDGRDVSRSAMRMGWSGSPWHSADRWIEAEELWARVKAQVPAEQRMSITFEEVVGAPHMALERVGAFLGCSYDPAMLSYPENSTYGAPDSSLTYQWRNKASEREIRMIEARIGTMLVDRGYRLSGLPVPTIGLLRRMLFGMENRWNYVLFKLRRVGFVPLLVRKIARLLHLRGVEKRAQIRINAIQERYIK